MKKLSVVAVIITALALMLTLVGPSSAQTSGVAPDPEKLVEGMHAAYDKVQDYTATFLKQERVKGELLPMETVALKFRKPFMVYMKWLKGPHDGREALYVQGKYDNKVTGHEGGFISFVTLHMEPTGSTAMKGNRHPITDVGIGRLIEIIDTNFTRAQKTHELKLTYIGVEPVNGSNAYHLKGELPADESKGYYGKTIQLWVDKGLGLPVKIMVFGWKDELLEMYTYKDLRLNPGLTEKDFDPTNSQYDF